MKKALVLPLLATLPLMAADDKKDDLFVSHLELGYIQTDGNTNTRTFNAEGNIKKDIEKHSFKLGFDGQYADDDGEKIKNRYKITGDYLYNFNDSLALGYVIGYKYDEFLGFDYQIATGPFVKYTALETKTQKLAFDVAGLYSRDKIKDGDSNDYGSAAAALSYEWQMLENLKFTENANYRVDVSDMDVYYVFSKTAFTSKISDMFSAGISYKVDYTNILPAGISSHTDKTFSINLILDY